MEKVCQVTIVHKEKVNVIKKKLDQKDFSNLLVLGKCFSDSSRIKIFYALETYKEMCVCDLAALLNVSQSAISHQLKTLKSARLVKYRRDGKVIYYSLDDEHVKHVFDEGLRHVTE